MPTITFGAGLSPAGLSPTGYGSPATADASTNGTPQPRLIRSDVRDYYVSSDGTYAPMTATQQRVQLALDTLRDSSSVEGLGLASPGGVITPTSQVDQRAAVDEALATLVAEGAISLLSFDVSQVGTRMERRIRWQDIAANTEETTVI